MMQRINHVDRKPLQVLQRGVAGAEIVERTDSRRALAQRKDDRLERGGHDPAATLAALPHPPPRNSARARGDARSRGMLMAVAAGALGVG
jgi:predicted phage gp36 major capsid-like protein